MKALPIWQPWASLAAAGVKGIETRHWPAPRWLVGQRMAIHACQTSAHLWLCLREPFSSHIADPEHLPRGYVIATVRLASCERMTSDWIAALRHDNPEEYAFGLYEPDRYAWTLEDAQLVDPVPFRGRQGLFDVPDDLLARRAAA